MDLIKRKLELIDFKLAVSPRYVFRHIIDKAPLVLPSVGLIIGVFLQNLTGLPIIFWLALSILFAASAVGYITVKKSASNLYVIAIIAFICFACLGAIRLDSYRHLPSNDISNFADDEKILATIRGTIISKPQISDNNDWAFAKFRFTDPGSSFYLKLDKIGEPNKWQETAGVVRVQVAESVLDLRAGDYVQVVCSLERIGPPSNPGQFDFAKYLARKNIFVAAFVKTRGGIELRSNNSERNGFLEIQNRLQQTVRNALAGELSDEQGKAVIEALLLGYRGEIDSVTILAFRRTGLFHFLSLSGLNFAILIAFIWWLCSFTGLGKKRQAAICITVSILFVMVVPPNPPVLRAAVISIVFCASFLFRRQPNPFNSLALAAIILLLANPADLYNAGWQLSFSTTLGILLFFRRIQLFIYEKISTPLQKTLKKEKFSILINEKSLFNISGLFSTGLAAWLGGAGLLVYHFYLITPLSSIWTVLASPLVTLITIIGFVKIIFSFFLPSAAAVIGLITAGLSKLLILLVIAMSKLDISSILTGHIPAAVVIIYYCTILFVAFLFWKRFLLRKVVSIVLISTLCISLFAGKIHRAFVKELILNCLDVGHGQSIVVQLPGGKNLLFDAGSLFSSDPGSKIIGPFLDYSGIEKIDALIVSHGDIDHINGIPEILQKCNVKCIYASRDFLKNIQKKNTTEYLTEFVEKSGIKIRDVNSLVIKDKALVKVIWPTERSGLTANFSDNDRSIVTLIEYGGKKILLCSDIEKKAQAAIMELYPELRADIVIVPHHGSKKTSEQGFLNRLGAAIRICSNSAEEQLQQDMMPNCSFQTAKDGAISVKVNNKGNIKADSFIKKAASVR